MPRNRPAGSYLILRVLRLLMTRGHTLDELAHRLKRDVRTVRRWLKAIQKAGFRLRRSTDRGDNRWRVTR